MVRRGALTALAAALLAIPAAAAAQDGYETDPTREQFVAEADPLCKKANAKTARIFKPIEKLVRKGELRAAGRKLIRGERIQLRLVGRLSEIDRPPADASTIGSWLRLTKRGIRTSIEAGRELKREKLRRAARTLDRADELFKKGARKVRGFGFKYCA